MNNLQENWKKVMISKHVTENSVIVAKGDTNSKNSASEKLHCLGVLQQLNEVLVL